MTKRNCVCGIVSMNTLNNMIYLRLIKFIMLRFPKLHKGWVPKNTRNDLISLFWLNRSDLWLEYKKRDIEVKMDFGDIPYENLKDKGWDYVNKKLKEIDELE